MHEAREDSGPGPRGTTSVATAASSDTDDYMIESAEFDDGAIAPPAPCTPGGTRLPAGPPPPVAVQSWRPISQQVSSAVAGVMMQQGFEVQRALTLFQGDWRMIGDSLRIDISFLGDETARHPNTLHFSDSGGPSGDNEDEPTGEDRNGRHAHVAAAAEETALTQDLYDTSGGVQAGRLASVLTRGDEVLVMLGPVPGPRAAPSTPPEFLAGAAASDASDAQFLSHTSAHPVTSDCLGISVDNSLDYDVGGDRRGAYGPTAGVGETIHDYDTHGTDGMGTGSTGSASSSTAHPSTGATT
ncbi:unnamed protein product [Symbiodinium sp. CCMP2592]|nr:unnamed protein product [Symbiodinium sp. CCMP2592]